MRTLPSAKQEGGRRGPCLCPDSESGHCISSSLQEGQLQRLQSMFPKMDRRQLAESEL